MQELLFETQGRLKIEDITEDKETLALWKPSNFQFGTTWCHHMETRETIKSLKK